MLGDIEVPEAMTEFLDDNHLQQHGEHIEGCQIVMEGQIVIHVEPMVEEDEQSSFGPGTNLD